MELGTVVSARKRFLTGWSMRAQVKIVLAIHADHPEEPLYGDQLELPRLGDQSGIAPLPWHPVIP